MSARGCCIFANGVLLRLILFRVASWCVSSIGDAGIKQKMHLFFSPLLQLVLLFEPFCFVSLQHVRTPAKWHYARTATDITMTAALFLSFMFGMTQMARSFMPPEMENRACNTWKYVLIVYEHNWKVLQTRMEVKSSAFWEGEYLRHNDISS